MDADKIFKKREENKKKCKEVSEPSDSFIEKTEIVRNVKIINQFVTLLALHVLWRY